MDTPTGQRVHGKRRPTGAEVRTLRPPQDLPRPNAHPRQRDHGASSPRSVLHMNDFTVGYLVGSLANASITRKLAKALSRLAPEELQLREIPIGELPLYSYDY